MAVEALQDSNLSSKSVSKFVYNKVALFFTFQIPVIPYTHVPTGKTFSLIALIVLFPGTRFPKSFLGMS